MGKLQDSDTKAGGVEKCGRSLVGRYVRKDFDGCGVFLGKIVSYKCGFYRILYEDEDSEDMEFHELQDVLLEDVANYKEIGIRMRKLDRLTLTGKRGIKRRPSKRSRRKKPPVISANGSDCLEASISNPGTEALESGGGGEKNDFLQGKQSVNGGAIGSNLEENVRTEESESFGFDGDPALSSVLSEVVETRGEIEHGVAGAETVTLREDGTLPAREGIASSITFEHSSVPEQRTSNGGSSSSLAPEKESQLEGFGRTNAVPSPLERLKPMQVDHENQLKVDNSDHTASNLGRTKSSLDSYDESFSDSCDSQDSVRILESTLATQMPLLRPEPLPPSSGDIAVPEESIASLFSVYNCLRSFSLQLFLSPFSLEDFVESLNCISANSLLDAVYVSLLRVLNRHLEMLSSEGSEIASKCLRNLDWSFLDTLTWPVYLAEYLLLMGPGDDLRPKVGHAGVLSGEFYSLNVSTKLSILQILCDSVIDSAELRAELDMRENREVDIDSDGKMGLPPYVNGSRSLHHCSNTSTDKEPETMKSIVKPNESPSFSSLDDEIMASEIKGSDVVHDWNSDECCLCSMDGTLVCCDGCPSAYHARCIGLNRALLPDGSWFCPECAVNRLGPTSSRIRKGLKGAEFFGIDPYNRALFGTCNYLLVLEDSLNADTFSRYYNANDVPKVLRVLHSSPQHSSLYSEICKGILEYWEIPGDISFSNPATEPGTNPVNRKEDAIGSTPLCTLPVKETHKLLNIVEHETGKKCCSPLDMVGQAECPDMQQCATGRHEISIKKMEALKIGIEPHNDQFAPGNPNLTDTQAQISTGSKAHEQFDTHSAISHENGQVDHGGSGKIKTDTIVVFKPQTYINHYFHGDVAASAAANLAVLASEDGKISGANVSSNSKKFLYQNVSLQIKAFMGAAMHFFWPCSEKKLMEVPREKCGWCISCKSPPTSRKGCLLNFATQNAIKGAGRAPGGLRPVKNGEGPLPAIAAYLLHIEESLRGLIAGSFINVNYRRQWRKQVEQSSTCRMLKLLLLKLEENIRLIALSSSWVNLVDDCLIDASAAQIGVCSLGQTQKRGPVGRRNKKSVTSGSTTDSFDAISKVVNWCSGGRFSKLGFNKGFLPSSTVKKAARHGGFRRIYGLFYADDSEIPRRIQQFAWRSSVEMCTNSSELALQVRYLDAHIRWNDLVLLEKTSQHGKESDMDASAFRNARICAKKEEKSELIYLLDFLNQKHLPACVMKNVVAVEQVQEGKDMFWFSENCIPLHLIKEYEEKVPLSLSKISNLSLKFQRGQLRAHRGDIFSYLVDKRVKTEKCTCSSCCKDVLIGEAVKCSTCQGYYHKDCTIASTSVREDRSKFVFTCYLCYHAESDAINENSQKYLNFQVTMHGPQDNFTTPSSKSIQLQNGYHHKRALGDRMEIHAQKPSSGPNSTGKKKREPEPYGLIWNRNTGHRPATDFRIHNILLRGNGDIDPSKRPTCSLCRKPYSPDLMYIRCEICQMWFHADAVRLEEAKIFNLMGFKCCKCRKKTLPTCPYMSTQEKRRPSRKINRGHRIHPKGDGISEREIEEPTTPALCTKPWDDGFVDDDDPLLFSLAKVEPITEMDLQKLPMSRTQVKHGKDVDGFPDTVEPVVDQKPIFLAEYTTGGLSYQSPKKLPVRRKVNPEKDVDGVFPLNSHGYKGLAAHGANLTNASDVSSPQVKWEFNGGLVNDVGVVLEDVDFEPQTYFSFTELLASEGERLVDFVGEPMDVAEDNWCGSSGCDDIRTVNCDNSSEPFESCKADSQWEDGVAVDPGTGLSACGVCALSKPVPDISCENCRCPIHRLCSKASWDGRWRCEFCQDQQ